MLSLPCCALQLRRTGAPACGLLTALAFPAVAHGLQGAGLLLLPFHSWAPDGRLSGCGTQASLLHRPVGSSQARDQTMCPALPGRFLTMGPARASPLQNLKIQKEALITLMVERRASRRRAQRKPRPQGRRRGPGSFVELQQQECVGEQGPVEALELICFGEGCWVYLWETLG